MVATMNESNESHIKEALQYWGYLFQSNKCGTELLDRLLSGIANYIVTHFEPSDSTDITPPQLAAFYKAVGGDYDGLFTQTSSASVAFIYRSLGCSHSLQPSPTDDGYQAPTIPALKKKGFMTWQTIQLLLGPQEHVPFLQNAVARFDIIDPETNQPFPKLLPKEAFPEKPDEAMVHWYEGVSEKLRREAEDEGIAAERASETEKERDRTSSDASEDERTGAAEYFHNPLYRNREGRPTVVRRYSKNPSYSPHSPRSYLDDRGRLTTNNVRHFWSPQRHSLPDNYGDEDPLPEDDITPTGHHPRYTYTRSPPPRREPTVSSTESEEDPSHPSPVLRHRRSHEPAHSPRDYTHSHADHGRRYSVEVRRSDPSSTGFGPTKAPLFATQVAQAQSSQHYDRRSSTPSWTGYSPRQNVRYTIKDPNIREHESAPIIREPIDRYDYPSRNSSRRPSREMDRAEMDRERGHDRDRHSDRERDRDRDRGRDRERDWERDSDRDRSRSHRYIKTDPLDGVGGRRYPVDAPWR